MITPFKIENATRHHAEGISALNNRSLEFMNSQATLSTQDVAAYFSLTSYFKVVVVDGVVSAFIMAVPSGRDHTDPNYQWFSKRYSSFLYIDRILVAKDQRGKGIGKLFYENIISFAEKNKIERLVCEVNVDPPNPASLSFHAGFHFVEVGRHWVDHGAKQVALLTRSGINSVTT